MLNELYLTKVTLPEPEKVKGYLKEIPAVRFLEEIELKSRVTFFAGENGTGKSTLLEAIAVACGFNPEGGTKNFCFSTNDTHSELCRYLKITRGYKRERDGFFFRAESFYNVATNIDELDQIPAAAPKVINAYGGESLHHQSHGESFFSLMMNRFGGRGLYILDEPEAALSPSRLLSMLTRIHELAGQDSQFVIATHSPILMAYPDADIFWLDEAGIRQVAYEETEHYQISRQFLQNPGRMLEILWEEQRSAGEAERNDGGDENNQ